MKNGRVVGLILLGLLLFVPAGLGLVCANTPPPPPGDSGVTGKYVGSQRCSQCHFNTHNDWLTTKHAGALDTLEAIGQGSNAACLGCHTVGFGDDGGYINRQTTNALAGVGCESCHGAARSHVDNVSDESLRPPLDIAATICGKCHTSNSHPTFDQWQSSKHSLVVESLANSFAGGSQFNSCGECHSGDYRFIVLQEGETVGDDYLLGVAREDMNAIACATCHDPHRRTGNAPFADAGRDYQLRFPAVAYPVATSTLAAATDETRFNLCGQCHHSRSATWQDTSRPPHRSVQSNIYVGEMPVPTGYPALVFSENSPHALVQGQCTTCHMHRQDFMSEVAPPISGHTFEVNYAGCVTSGCHPSADSAQALAQSLARTVNDLANDVYTRLGNPATWEYSSNGGPDSAGQAGISVETKQIRFLYYYAVYDGSGGVHNPGYVKALLNRAREILTSTGR